MGIFKIEIENYKSIKHCTLSLNDINLLIGENGTGKTNVLDAVEFFFRNLLNEAGDEGTYNYQNKFCNEFTISITLDFQHLKKISGNNKNKDTDTDFLGYYEWIGRRERWETVTLHKIKGKPVRWNRERKYRQNILNLFPVYFIDAREVNLTDWSRLWDIIGDLMKVHRAKEKEIAGAISAIKDEPEYKLRERYGRLSESLVKANIQIKPFTPKQYASAISSLLFKGNEFEFKKSRLDYMSNGTNAFNYTNLLIEVLKLISEFKIKDPIVILDEPEISLHHKLIDQLGERMFSCEGMIQFLAASHSPRFLKNILKAEQSNCEIFHVSSQGGYTCAKPISLFSEEADNRPRVFMTDQHASAYFSRYILSVEGATEAELFSNAYLRELYPFLKNVDVMEGMSDDVVQKIISPRQRQFQTQFLFLMDMDKALPARKEGGGFVLESKYFSNSSPWPENYYYSPERTQQLLRKKRIKAMAEKCRFRYWEPFFSCKDANFTEFIDLIKAYLIRSNIFVFRTTVEGALINYRNLSYFNAFCSSRIYSREIWDELEGRYDSFLKNDKLNFMRLLFCGKSDFLLKLDNIKEHSEKVDSDLHALMMKNRIGKTSGWVTQWLDYYFCDSVDIDPGSASALGQFKKIISDANMKYSLRSGFRKRFPELDSVICTVRNQINLW